MNPVKPMKRNGTRKLWALLHLEAKYLPGLSRVLSYPVYPAGEVLASSKTPAEIHRAGILSYKTTCTWFAIILHCMLALLYQCWLCGKLYRWYTQHTSADRYVGENNRPLALAKVSEKTENRTTSHFDWLFCASSLQIRGKYILLILARFSEFFVCFVLFCSE